MLLINRLINIHEILPIFRFTSVFLENSNKMITDLFTLSSIRFSTIEGGVLAMLLLNKELETKNLEWRYIKEKIALKHE